MKIHSQTIQFNADVYTPVKLYLALRHKHRKTCLLESNDYHSRQESKSFIGLDPIVEIQQIEDNVYLNISGDKSIKPLNTDVLYSVQIQSLLEEFQFEEKQFNGFFGRLGFEYNMHDETHISNSKSDLEIPILHAFIYKYIIVIDHFTNEGYIVENNLSGDFTIKDSDDLLKNETFVNLPFEKVGNERASFTDQEFTQLVTRSIEHCKRGDVFQLVVSNAFEQSFFGDDFQVYRQLRRLNPSPYLFYFDFEDYRLFGSSPEAQLVIEKEFAEIHPIAGTIPRTGVKETDDLQLEFLLSDAKENAEHTMLVDLARNDLSRNCSEVNVANYKEVQHFSHVTHLVSKVIGKMDHKQNFKALCNSFPAGTLSGTPKPKALELIHQYENSTRDYYGGAIGIFTANDDLNMAIVIRSMLSKNNTLHYRAGAGVVINSIPDRETKEVHHKLRAVRTAIEMTQNHFKKELKCK
jgi:anthranilate synthase component 1